MTRTRTTAALLLAAALGLPGFALAEERVAGTVVAIDADLVVIELGDEPAVAQGSVLKAWRRLPSTRGSAPYRASGLWWEVAELTVIQVGDGVAVARRTGDPLTAVPAALDESGAAAEQVHIGDRVRATGAVGERSVGVRVTFPREELFGEADVEFPEHGAATMKHWLRGLSSMELPITVEVHARMEELGGEAPDLSRSMSADDDAPYGPSPGEPVVPVDGLDGSVALPAEPPPAHEVMVVDRVARDGQPDVWRYLDPVTLARRRGARVAGALANHLGIDPDLVLITVVPRGQSASYPHAIGYDRPGDQIRILAAGIEWEDPGPAPRPKPRTTEKPVGEEEDQPRRRRLLERMPAEVSLAPRSPSGDEPERER